MPHQNGNVPKTKSNFVYATYFTKASNLHQDILQIALAENHVPTKWFDLANCYITYISKGSNYYRSTCSYLRKILSLIIQLEIEIFYWWNIYYDDYCDFLCALEGQIEFSNPMFLYVPVITIPSRTAENHPSWRATLFYSGT